MARKPSVRVVVNREALDRVHLALADGVEEVCRTIVEVAADNAPDSPFEPFPTGEGLPKQGGWLVYDGSKKVAGGSLRGVQPKKPRAFKAESGGITGIAGFGFPARFAEAGTVDTPAQPFFTPAAVAVRAAAPGIMKSVVGSRLGGRR